jgi:insertion element IS1 protein InsB
MTCIAVLCPHGHSEQSVTRGKTARGPQRSLCQHALCATGSCLLASRNRGCVSEVTQHRIDRSLHASGVRDTARSLPIRPTTVLSELKKKEGGLESVHTALLRTLTPETVAVDMAQAGEAEMDEMWSFVGHKGNPRWLWHAIDHHTGKVLAYVFGRRQDTVFLQLKALLEPFGSHNIIPIIGVPTRVTSILKSTPQASEIRRKSSGSI